jgi:DNA-binding IclR family transcriptional regulator
MVRKMAIASVQKGLDILRLFGFGKGDISAQAISEQLNIPLSTTYRYLETLTERGFLVRNRDTKNYELGFMLFKLGNVVPSQTKLAEIILPHMRSLSSLSGETVLLTVIGRWEAVCIEKVETNKTIKLSLERGLSLPLYAGASSKILLAYQKDSYVNSFLRNVPLVRLTKNTTTDPIKLRKELKTIREQGYAFTDQEADLGAKAIAGPVFDRQGEIAAGLSIAGPRDRINQKNKANLIQLVKRSAQKASYDLGYTEAIKKSP